MWVIVIYKVFILEVAAPESDMVPQQGTVEIIAPDFMTACLWLQEECPGIHVIQLVHEYWLHEKRGTA